jgi:uncharacterized protein (DUF697 family)/tellurite resistance protein
MPNQTELLSDQEHKAMLNICILAALADGCEEDVERTQIERIVSGFSSEGERLDAAATYQEVVAGGKVSLPQVAAQLKDPSTKTLAYEMAVCVCHADGVLKDPERQFLTQLRQALQLGAASTETHLQMAHAMVEQPLASAAPPIINPARDGDLDKMILNAAILNGALEIMPHTLATMAIIPLQMRLVYQIGKHYGFELDSGHVKDFLATVGIGLTSQVFEGFTRRLVGGLARGIAGGLLGGLAGQAAGSAFGFATTYALGQVAKQYYASGRTLTTDQLKSVFSSMIDQARSMQGRYSGDISRKAQQVNVSELLPLVRGR